MLDTVAWNGRIHHNCQDAQRLGGCELAMGIEERQKPENIAKSLGEKLTSGEVQGGQHRVVAQRPSDLQLTETLESSSI